jgi:hypothetical protein
MVGIHGRKESSQEAEKNKHKEHEINDLIEKSSIL